MLSAGAYGVLQVVLAGSLALVWSSASALEFAKWLTKQQLHLVVNVKRINSRRGNAPALTFGPRRDWRWCPQSICMLQLNYTPAHIIFINTGTQFKAKVQTCKKVAAIAQA